MKISKKSRQEAKQLFRSCLQNGVLDENRALTAVRRVVELKPRGYPAILFQFHRLARLEAARRVANVESVRELSESLAAGIRANLGRLYGQELRVSFRQNPALIGGLRIQVGSDVYDGSLQTKLNRLEES